jgi:hypothetical protein
MKTMDIIFNNEDYYNALIWDTDEWSEEHEVPRAKTIIGVMEDNVDGIDYYIVTVNETIFSYLMWKEFDMTEKYGREGWNRWIESSYNCETA